MDIERKIRSLLKEMSDRIEEVTKKPPDPTSEAQMDLCKKISWYICTCLQIQGVYGDRDYNEQGATILEKFWRGYFSLLTPSEADFYLNEADAWAVSNEVKYIHELAKRVAQFSSDSYATDHERADMTEVLIGLRRMCEEENLKKFEVFAGPPPPPVKKELALRRQLRVVSP